MPSCSTRTIRIPDQRKLALCKQTPERGPHILFFSGGTALREASRELIRYTHNSIHLITPFDSGGSSAVLREAFGMPAVGDIRNRLMALADQSVKGNPEIFELFTYRLSKTAQQDELQKELKDMAQANNPLVRDIPAPMRRVICNHFKNFIKLMPPDFNLKGASIGNLVLTAGYLTNRRQLDPVIDIFSRLAHVHGRVRATINKNLHLAVHLQNGNIVVGQHNITAKEVAPLASAITDIWLTDSLDSDKPVQTPISPKTRNCIAEASLICYPIGSFYSSVIANLIPQGTGRTIAENTCPKLFVPNTTADPETIGMSVADQVGTLQKHLVRSGAPNEIAGLELVLIDSRNADYPNGIDLPGLKGRGVEIIDTKLVTPTSSPFIDAHRLNEVLLSLA
ncbi:GAK system CofD-like protein [uncultured Pseudodesulfovibrio sp.]|uniref:GAK system CofD-like protein n=1 Tax=uncultured Pseudodesulfovibrio sp. TaxID=2035858 RepID=UPI0029C74255|nr:GAK system CofD-like protein [uncultured Pseudodesulfovibrio sp.]